MPGDFTPSDSAYRASEHYNGLPLDERARLAPLLEHYRQMGIAEAADALRSVEARLASRIKTIRDGE